MNKLYLTHSQQSIPVVPHFRASALLGQTVLTLRRAAAAEISDFKARKLLNMAAALEGQVRAIEALEAR